MKNDDRRCHVRLTDYSDGVYGIKTEINGFELPEVTTIKFEAPPDDLAHLTVGMFPSRPLEISVSAAVTINFIVPPGFYAMETVVDGMKIVQVRPEQPELKL